MTHNEMIPWLALLGFKECTGSGSVSAENWELHIKKRLMIDVYVRPTGVSVLLYFETDEAKRYAGRNFADAALAIQVAMDELKERGNE